jgi:release factor glutamine methyltransferase
MAEGTQQKTSWTIKKLLEWTTDYFGKASLEQPRLAAEILLAHVLRCQRIDLYVQFDRCPEPGQRDEFRSLVQRAVDHEPVAYLTGTAHFFSMEFEVSPAVLIPRPETEVLAASAIDFCRHETIRPTVDVLDLCTGSGCVGIAIAANVVETEVVAIDTSAEALEMARKNVDKHELEGRVSLLESDLFEHLDQASKGIFDVIVSNPPYISASAYENLPSRVKNYEPVEALRAGDDGLDIHRRIISGAERYLADEGAILVEVAYDQAEEVIVLFEECDYLKEVSTVRDNLGHKRVVKGKKK